MNKLPNKGSFKKGSIPWNKKTKGIMKRNSGSFKKGIIPKNKLPIGTTTIRVDHIKRTGHCRRWIKIAEPNVWMTYAHYIWIKNGNDLIDGMVIHHIDYNTLNDDIRNLSQMDLRDHMAIHRRELYK